MKRYVLAATLSLFVGVGAQASVIDLDVVQPLPVASANRPTVSVPMSVRMSELPEPEVFVMMLVGLILIGYRARRDSSEKFK